MFPDIAYLEWIRAQKAETTWDLGSSGLGGRSEAVVPERLASLPDPPEATELEAQIADQYDETITEENVLVTAGATHANVLAFAAAIDGATTESPAIAVEEPGYEPLLATPQGLGAELQRVERDPEDGYDLTPAALQAGIDETTAMVVISNRHNPSGHILSRPELADLAGPCQEQGASLLVDEVYAPYRPTADSGPGTAFGGPTVAGIEGGVVTNSLTKFFGLGGLRIGWIVADSEFIERATRIAYHFPDVAEPSRALAKRMFHNLDRIVTDARERVRSNAALLAEFVDSRPELEGPVAEGSTYGFLRHASADGDKVHEAAMEEGILVVPGRYYEDRDRFRLSVGGEADVMRESLERFGDVLDTGV